MPFISFAIRAATAYILAGFFAALFVLAIGLPEPKALAYGTVIQVATTALLLAFPPARKPRPSSGH